MGVINKERDEDIRQFQVGPIKKYKKPISFSYGSEPTFEMIIGSKQSMIPKSPSRLVLDTNVCLDLFVFRDARWQRLMQSMQSGHIECVTRDDCRTEWTLVLAYDRFGLDAKARDVAMAEFDRWIKPVDALLPTDAKLPVCKDADDQKFIELAFSSGAAYLVSKDKALLKLARRIRKLGLFEICSPEQWVARHADMKKLAY